MDAIALLKQDHKTVEGLFKQYEALGDRAVKQKQKVVAKIIRELAIHSAIEEMLFYPAVRAAAARNQSRTNEAADDLVLESLEEHHIVKWTLAELEKMSPEDERYDAKMQVLMESVKHHVEEEEEDLFPKAQRLLKNVLDDLGVRMEKAKKLAPTRPHPRSPDEPPGNFISGPIAAMADKGKDLVRDLAAKAKNSRMGKSIRELDS
jgi:hemerythrin superfamily protein